MIDKPKVPDTPWNLSWREYEVILLLSRVGYTKIVAGKLGVGVKTIESHMARIKRKMNERHSTLCAVKFDRWRTRMRRGDGLDQYLP